jgi:hypothetical protein
MFWMFVIISRRLNRPAHHCLAVQDLCYFVPAKNIPRPLMRSFYFITWRFKWGAIIIIYFINNDTNISGSFYGDFWIKYIVHYRGVGIDWTVWGWDWSRGQVQKWRVRVRDKLKSVGEFWSHDCNGEVQNLTSKKGSYGFTTTEKHLSWLYI